MHEHIGILSAHAHAKQNNKECSRHFVCHAQALRFVVNDLRIQEHSMERFDRESKLHMKVQHLWISRCSRSFYMARNQQWECAPNGKTLEHGCLYFSLLQHLCGILKKRNCKVSLYIMNVLHCEFKALVQNRSCRNDACSSY